MQLAQGSTGGLCVVTHVVTVLSRKGEREQLLGKSGAI